MSLFQCVILLLPPSFSSCFTFHLIALFIYLRFPKYSTAEEGGRLRAGVVLLTGLMETMAKYGETIGYLNDRYDTSAAKSVMR